MEGEKAFAQKCLGLNAEMQPGWSELPLNEAHETEVLLLALKITCCVKLGSICALALFAYVTHLVQLCLPSALQNRTCV